MPTNNDVSAWDKEYAHVNWADGVDFSDILSALGDGAFVFDAGCGNGRYLKELRTRFSCVGMDLSAEAVFGAARLLSGKKTPAASFPDLFTGSVTAVPFAGETFDAVLSFGVFQHLNAPDRSAAAAELFRVLKPGGLFFFESFGADDMRYGGTPYEYPGGVCEPDTFVRKSGILYHYFREPEVLSLFGDAGFEPLSVTHRRRGKTFRGQEYVRHHIRAVFKKSV